MYRRYASMFGRALSAAMGIVTAFGCQQMKPPPPPPAPRVVAKPIDYTQELPAGQLALGKIPPDQYPPFSFDQTNLADLRAALDNSLTYLRKPSSWAHFRYEDITHDRAVATCYALRQTIDELQGQSPPADVNAAIAGRFEVYESVGAPRPDGRGYTNEVLFTGYCTPIYPASLTPTAEYRFPLYKRPADLIAGPDDADGPAPGRRRDASGALVPYPTRRDIETTNLLAGDELVWLNDRFNAYVASVQGSARLQLPDGRLLDVGYAGNNGQPYVSPGRQMVADGLVAKNDLSLPTLRAYFAAHPEATDKYLLANPRTMFFAVRDGGPFGSLNVPVTANVTMATDKSVYPRALPAFVIAPHTPHGVLPDLRQFRVDQDSGGAIRAAGRADLYMGVGPDAEALAGAELAAGHLYYLAVRPELVDQFLHP